VHDDTSWCGTLEVVKTGSKIVEEAVAPVGLVVRKDKCKLMTPGQPTAHDIETAAAHGWTIVDGSKDCLRLVGGFIGSRDAVKVAIRKKLEETKDVANKITILGENQPRAALALLRFCAQQKLYYTFANHPPDLTKDIALEWKKFLYDCVCSILTFKPPINIVFTSVFGFTDYTELADTIFRHNTTMFASKGPASPVDPVAEARSSIDNRVFNTLPYKARALSLLSAALPSWGGVSPFAIHGATACKSDVIQYYKFLTGNERSLRACHCGEVDDGKGVFLEHVLTCSSVRGSNRTYRHNMVVSALVYNLRRFGGIVSVEPTMYSYDDGSAKRPDITVLGSPSVCTDFTISSNVEAALIGKAKKHGPAVSAASHQFIPTAMDIWGTIHKSVDNFLKNALAHLQPAVLRKAVLETKKAMTEAWIIGSVALYNAVAQQHVTHHVDYATAMMMARDLEALVV
jgi:hypothetical protein